MLLPLPNDDSIIFMWLSSHTPAGHTGQRQQGMPRQANMRSAAAVLYRTG